jgi:hypothetical protein
MWTSLFNDIESTARKECHPISNWRFLSPMYQKAYPLWSYVDFKGRQIIDIGLVIELSKGWNTIDFWIGILFGTWSKDLNDIELRVNI